MGFDGNYGFATPPFEDANGDSGQAFTNSGRVELISDNHDFNFATGTLVEFSYLVGSDRNDNNQPLTAIASASLIFDLGLPSEFRHDFEQRSGTGIIDPLDNTNLDFNRVFESYTTSADYRTIQLRIDLTNELQLGDLPATQRARSLVDKVSLVATGDRINTIPEPNSLRLLSFSVLNCVFRRRRTLMVRLAQN